EAASLSEVPLPDGKTMKRSECDAVTDEMEKSACVGVFIDVTRCRADAKGQVGTECEKKVIEEYVKSKAEASDDSWDTEETDAGPDEGDKGAEDTDGE
ncbi:MAG TPA: hypothetical protein VFU21_00725, partial [Kofleriaceae bacterium]|nr:hypothetical protein [Kofleriaceae bacterium]